MHESKGRDGQQAFLIEGYRALRQILLSSPGSVLEIIRTEAMEAPKEATCPCRCLTEAQFKRIALSRTPAGPLAVVAMPERVGSALPPREPGERILALEDIQDPGNVGTLIRSAAAFDFSGIVCSDKCADPFSPKAIQASCGAIVSVWIRRSSHFGETLSSLRDGGYRIVAADIGGKPLTDVRKPAGKMVLILGNEGSGLSERTLEKAHDTITIPMNARKVESLNVAATGAILMFLSRFFQGDAGASVAF